MVRVVPFRTPLGRRGRRDSQCANQISTASSPTVIGSEVVQRRLVIGRAVRLGAGADRRGAITAASDLNKVPTCRTCATVSSGSSNISSPSCISVDLAPGDISRDGRHFGVARSNGALASLLDPACVSAHALTEGEVRRLSLRSSNASARRPIREMGWALRLRLSLSGGVCFFLADCLLAALSCGLRCSTCAVVSGGSCSNKLRPSPKMRMFKSNCPNAALIMALVVSVWTFISVGDMVTRHWKISYREGANGGSIKLGWGNPPAMGRSTVRAFLKAPGSREAPKQ